MNTENIEAYVAIGIIAGGLGVLGVLGASGQLSNPCEIVKPPAVVEYAAKGDLPGQTPRGGYWIADGEIIGFSYAEDDPVKTVSCFPELDENEKRWYDTET